VSTQREIVTAQYIIAFVLLSGEALGFTQPLTEMSTRSRKVMFLGSRAWPVRRADSEPTV
jgi:hypothetical protein